MSPKSSRRNNLCVVSHRCLGFGAPANSSTALSRALQSDVDEVELDFRQTKDGEFVASHTPWYVTRAGRPYQISTLSFSQAVELGCLALSEALEIFSQLGAHKRLRIEMKNSGAEDKLLQSVSEYGLLDRVVIVSWKRMALRRLRELSPSVSLSLSYILGLHGDGFLPLASPSSLPTAVCDPAIRLESVNILSAFGTPSARLIKTFRDRSIDVFVIGGDGPTTAETFLDLGVRGVLTSSRDFLIATKRGEREV